MALTQEQKDKISKFVRQRIKDGKAPLTEAGRKAMLEKRPPANKLPA